MKKFLAISLAALTVLASVSLVSCGNGDGENTLDHVTQSPSKDIDPNYLPELSADVNYNGKEFNILTNSGFWSEKIDEESESEDPVSSAIYQRNRAIEQRYGVKINEVQNDSPKTAIQTSYNAGTDDYDAVSLCASDCASLAVNGYFQDLYNIDNLNLEKYYWDQALIRDLSVDDKLFYATGDLFYTPLAGTFVILFNKKMQGDYDLPDFYDMVRNKTWTVDYLTQLVNDPAYGYKDNGDGAVDVADTYSFAIQRECYLAFFYGLGGKLTVKDSAGMPEANLTTRTNLTLVEKINALTNTGDNVIDTHEWITGPTATSDFASVRAFFEGRALFFSSNISNVDQFREMEYDFGVLPLPLFDENSDYYSFVYSGANVVAIPMQNKEDASFAGFVLEALCAESYQTLTPAYYEKVLKGKYQRDEESYEMIDIACRNRVWDLGYVCNFASICDPFTDQIKKGANTFASFMSKYERPFNSALGKYIEAYEKSES